MANLRTNNLSGEQGQNAYRGSVLLESASSSRISVTNTTGLDFGTDQFTIEFWIYLLKGAPVNKNIFARSTSASNTTGMIMWFDGNGHLEFDSIHGVSGAVHTGAAIGNDMWHHIAVTRDSSNNTRLYLNGVNKASASSDTSNIVGATNLQIASNIDASGYYNDAYISNFRMVKGTAIYSGTTDFTPPQSELTVVDGTILLCCQDSNDPTQEATDKTVTGFGNLATAGYLGTQPKVIPPYGVDAGNAFGGSIQQSTQGYMCFPTGRTDERGRGRAVIWLGSNNPDGSYTKDLDYFDIQSLGTTTKFGEISDTVGLGAGMSSSTRGVFAGGTKPAAGNQNLLEFITIATTGNALDFGGIGTLFRYGAGISNQTRGLIAGAYQGGGASGTYNIIQFITIASLGDTADFGDIVANSGNGIYGAGSCSSSTRGITFGGGTGPSNVDEINHITIGTLGNSVDFGDLSAGRNYCQGVSSSTRGVVGGGDNSSGSDVNIIEFITIASTGNATDFGDLLSAGAHPGSSGASNKIRGVFVGGGQYPTYDNTMEFITIATTGNALDFGDISTSGEKPYGCVAVSGNHGGLS